MSLREAVQEFLAVAEWPIDCASDQGRHPPARYCPYCYRRRDWGHGPGCPMERLKEAVADPEKS